MQNQKKWMADLRAFLDKFGKSDEALKVLRQAAAGGYRDADSLRTPSITRFSGKVPTRSVGAPAS